MTPVKLAAARVGAAVALWAAVALLFPGTAFAWSVTNPVADIIRIERSSTETGALTFTLYATAQYPNATQLAAGSFDETSSGGRFYQSPSVDVVFDASTNVVEFPLQTWYSNGLSAMVAGPGGKAVVVNLAQRVQAFPTYVRVASSLPGTWPVSVVGTVPVSQAASVSVDGTLPVTVAGLGAFGSDDVTVAVVVALLVAAVLIVATMRRGSHASD